MNKLLNDGYEKVQYLVTVDGKTIQRTLSESAAETFINTLPIDIKERARIVPATSDGKEILFG